MPNVKKAELIEGVVHMPSPVRDEHSSSQFDLITCLGLYRLCTPGVAGGDNGTLRLDIDNEPQPDGFLRILETHGGQTRIDAEGYVVGAPELVVEVSVSRVSIDLHSKLNVYRRNGAKEYLVWRVLERELDWFILRDGAYQRIEPTSKGLYKSEVFPGLWLDAPALLRGDGRAVLAAANKGLASRPHAAFVKQLAARLAR
jgi:Uma2 family endonuclease